MRKQIPSSPRAREMFKKISGTGTTTEGLINMVLAGAEQAEKLSCHEEDTYAAVAKDRYALAVKLEEDLDPQGWHVHQMTWHSGSLREELRTLWVLALSGEETSIGTVECSREDFHANLFQIYTQAIPYAPPDSPRKELLARLEKEIQRRLGEVKLKEEKGSVKIEIPSVLLDDFARLVLK